MPYFEILKSISMLIAIWVAIYGIDAWRREYVAKRQIELAEDTLALFYEAMDVIRFIRNPLSFDYETNEVKKEETETEEDYQARKRASVVICRYNQHQEIFNKIHASRYRFMAQIGKDQSKPFDDLKAVVNEIIHATRMLSRLWSRRIPQTEEEKSRHFDDLDKYQSIFWDGWKDDDPINIKLEQLTKGIENVCRPIIEGKGAFHGLLNTDLTTIQLTKPFSGRAKGARR